MAIKTKQELHSELPTLVKSKGLVSSTKTTADSLRQMLVDIIDSMGIYTETMPEGSIIEWYGEISNIPPYWILCDGRFGSPDLRDKFVVGAGLTYAVGATGGSTMHTHSGSVGGHALTIPEMPSHSHGYIAYVQSGSNDGSGGEAAGNFQTSQVNSTGGGQEHSHPLTINSAISLPPFHSLAYIMYKGLNFVIDTNPPTQPTNLTFSNVTETSMTLTWSASTDNIGVAGYDIYINSVYVSTVGTSSLLYNAVGLTPGTNYGFSIRARDSYGNVSTTLTAFNSTVTPVVVPDPDPVGDVGPSTPTNLYGYTQSSETEIILFWDASTDDVGVAEYEIYKSEGGDSNYFLIGTSVTTEYIDGNIQQASVYWYKVRAVDADYNISNDSTAYRIDTNFQM